MTKHLPGFLAGLIVGGLLIGSYLHRSHENELAGAAFVLQLESAQAAARTLRALDERPLDTARELLRGRLESAIDASYRTMTSERPALIQPMPELLAGVVEAEEYLAANHAGDHRIPWLREMREYLEGASAGPE